MPPKKVLILLTNNFSNDARVLKEGRSLAKAGYDVTLACYTYGTLPKSENIDGIKVERIYYYKNKFKKFIFIKFMIAAFFILRYYAVVFFRYRAKYDIIHCNDLLTLPLGVMLKKMTRRQTKVVYDAHEYETEINGITGVRKAVYRLLERIFIYEVDKVITVSPSIANEYARIYDIEKPDLVLNCPPYTDDVQNDIFRTKFNIPNDTTIFLYQGGLYRARGIEMLLKAFEKRTTQDKVIIFMGYGPLAVDIQAMAAASSVIFYHPAVSQDVLLDHTSSADIGVCMTPNTCLNHYYCLPNKFFEYTMAGVPVMVSDLFELGRVINEFKNGYIIEGEDLQAFTHAIDKVNVSDLEKMKARIPTVKKQYNWENQEKNLLRIYNSL